MDELKTGVDLTRINVPRELGRKVPFIKPGCRRIHRF